MYKPSVTRIITTIRFCTFADVFILNKHAMVIRTTTMIPAILGVKNGKITGRYCPVEIPSTLKFKVSKIMFQTSRNPITGLINRDTYRYCPPFAGIAEEILIYGRHKIIAHKPANK